MRDKGRGDSREMKRSKEERYGRKREWWCLGGE